MIDFDLIYSQLTDQLNGKQKRLDCNSQLGVYYGMSPDGYLRLAFLSSSTAPKLESTKLLKVRQGRESDSVYWTCFDLAQNEAKKVFFTFCGNMVDAISGVKDEKEALSVLKKRYVTWKAMFQRELKQGASREVIQGLFGELYFLKNILSQKYDISECIKGWSGPLSTSKDFSINEEWYEIKTIGVSSNTVHISSVSQLSSESDGHLIILKVEKMSEAYSNGQSSIEEMLKVILGTLEDEIAEAIFIEKINSFGIDLSDENIGLKFDVRECASYKVDDRFPRLKETDVKHSEICDVSYSLVVSALKEYKED